MQLKRIILSDLTFFIIMILLGVLSVISYQRINDLSTQSDKVSHTNQVKLKLEQTLSHIIDAETRQRFYLLTQDSSYLLPFDEIVKKNNENLVKLDSLTKDNFAEQQHLPELQILTNKRFEHLRTSVTLRSKGSTDLMARLTEGKSIMDEIRVVIAKMIQIEDDLLVDRKSQKNYAASITPQISLALSVFSILIVCIAYYILRRETRLRFQVQDDVKKLNDYFKDLPALFAIVKGPQHIHELGNTQYHIISGNRELTGKSYRQAFPELGGQGIYELLDKVYQSGEAYVGKEVPVARLGVKSKRYFNFIFQPIIRQKQTEGILIFGYEITEMIEARKKVEEAEQQSRLAIEAANIGTFDWDMENNRFEWSQRFVEIFGITDPNIKVNRQTLLDMYHPADFPIREKALLDSYETGKLSYEARVVWPNGSVHWVSVHGKTIYNNKKEALRMYGTAIDITHQKEALEELTESEAKFRLLADSMPQFVWTADLDGHLDYFNMSLFDYSGLSVEDIQKDGWISIVHPDEREENIKAWMEAVAAGAEFVFEHRFKNKEGEYRWQFSRAIPQKDLDGSIQRWVGTSSDIQDQKNYAQKLEKQITDRTQELSDLNKNLLIRNNIFAQAEENAFIGSYSWNLQTKEMEYSDNLYRLFGYEPHEFVPSFEKYFSMVHPDDKEQVMEDGMKTLDTRVLSAHTYRIITKNGVTKYFRSTGKIIGETENVMLIGTVQDISQDTLLNEILRIKNLELERSNDELESFNYIASHDLQEPLRKIQAFSQRILQKEGGNFSGFSKDYFSRINSSAARMQDLINALLSYSRADTSMNDMSPVDLNILLDNVCADLQDMIDEKAAVVTFAQLPTITAVSIQMQQLFVNLVSNSIKYSKAAVPPRIEITAAVVNGIDIDDITANKRNTYWKITLTDNGIGFEQEYEHKIFELFQRLHSNDHYTGTGIGLAICKKIMRNHQGFISAKGAPGIGSTFHIYFPFS